MIKRINTKPNYPVDTSDDGMSQAATSVIYQYDVSAIPYNKRPQTYTADLLVFDGTNYLEIPYTPALNTPEFTVSVWCMY